MTEKRYLYEFFEKYFARDIFSVRHVLGRNRNPKRQYFRTGNGICFRGDGDCQPLCFIQVTAENIELGDNSPYFGMHYTLQCLLFGLFQRKNA